MITNFNMKRMKNLFKGAALLVGLFAATSVANAQQKIGHVNADEVFQQTTEFKAAQDQLKTLSDAKQKELESMITEFQKKESAAQEKLRNRSEANKAQIDAEVQTLGQELQQMQERIQSVQKVAQEEVGKKQQELMAPIQTKVMNAINAVAKEKGFAYVLDLGTGAVIYADGGEDITPAVKTKLGIK